MKDTRLHIAVQQTPFDCQQVQQAMCQDYPDIGAVVQFVGLVRDDPASQGEHGALQSLLLEHYPGMTERALRQIVSAACERWPLQAVSLIHRVGELRPGEQIVLLAVASSHRQQAFLAAQFLMDYLKTEAPFWKKQCYQDGHCEWVNARQSDHDAVTRWQ